MHPDIPLKQCLEELGIPHAALTDDAWESAVDVELPAGDRMTFPVLFAPFEDDFSTAFVRLAVVPFPELASGEAAPRVAVQLARLHDRIMGVKFALDEDGDWGRVLDVPAADLSAIRLEAGLRQLALYSGACLTEIRASAPPDSLPASPKGAE